MRITVFFIFKLLQVEMGFLTRPDGQNRACYTVCRGQDSGFTRMLTVIREVIDKTKKKTDSE